MLTPLPKPITQQVLNYFMRTGVLGMILLSSLPLLSAPLTYTLSLEEAERQAVAASYSLVLAQAQKKAADEMVQEYRAALRPVITLDGSYRYIDEISSVRMGPNTIEFTQHDNYSIGPTVSYELLNGGASRSALESARRLSAARSREEEAVQLAQLAAVRAAYLGVQLSIENQANVAESLLLTQARMKDMRSRERAGAASHLDLISMEREELELRLRFEQATAALAMNLRKLTTLLDDNRSLPEPLIPIGNKLRHSYPQGSAEANVVVTCESFAKTAAALQQHISELPNRNHPRLAALEETAKAADLAAESIDRSTYPSLRIFAKATYDYPNGPVDEALVQKAVGMTFTMKIYDGGRTRALKAQKASEAIIRRYQKAQLEREFEESWLNARTALSTLQSQLAIAEKSINKAKDEARVVFQNYKLGVRSYLDVQRADTKVLEAEFSRSRLMAQMIAELTTLNQLSANPDQ
jgi:outer membrane protein TolC